MIFTAEYIKAFESSLQLLCADKVIEVMVMALFSSNFLNDATSEQVQEPLKILLRFLDIFSRFDWANWAVSVAGLIALPHSSPTAPAIGIAAGTNPMGMSRDEDVGTETDSPLSSAIPSPLSSSSCESEAYPYPVVGDANLTGIINQYRVRLRLSSLSEEDNTPIRQLSTDTDVEDCSCDYDKNRMKMRRQSGLSKLEPGELRRGSVQSSGGAVEVPPTEDEEKLSQLMQWGMIVLDPTKNLTNLCVSDSTSTQVSKYKQQEALKRTFAAGLVIVKRTIDALEAPFKFFDETVETPDLNKEDKSSAAQVAGIVSQIFPTLSKLTAIKESLSALHNGAVVDAAELVDRLQKDSSSVHNNLQYAEEAMAAKMSTTTATAPPAQPSHSLTFKEDQDTESINSAPLSMCLTLPDQVDNLALSEISISKSFSSFDSDVGSEYSINLGGEATNDAAIRFLSANTLPEEPPFVSYDSYMSKQQQQQQLNMSLSLMDPSGMDSYNPTPAYQNEGAQHGHQPHQSMSKILGSSSLEYIKPSALDFHHHHQKTLLRHTQSIGQGGLAYSQSSPSIIRPPSVPVPRAVDFQQEHMSAPGLHQLPIGHSPTNVPTQPTKPPGVPFIQPFVVKEMQVWVPGKFGASSGSPAVPKAPIPLPVAGVKSVDFVKGSYPPMAPVGHVAGPLTSAGTHVVESFFVHHTFAINIY